MSSKSIISFAVGDSVVFHGYSHEYPGRVIAVDLKGDRPIAVASELNGQENVFTFKKDGSTGSSQFYLTKVPVVRFEYRTFGAYNSNIYTSETSVGGKPFKDLENLKSTFPDSKSQLKFTYVDEEVTSVELIKE